MVGGRDYWNEDDDFARINLATGGVTGRQAGSAFKPFALVAALEHGVPRTQPLNGSTAHILLQEGTYWDPHNAEGGGYGTISLESATINSVNVAYANLLSVIGSGDTYAGASALVEAAVRMGIRCCPRTTEPNGPLAAVPSAVLGVNEVSTLEMASAYGTLADLGRHVQPTPVISVTTSDGDVIYQAPSRAEQAVEPAIAAEAVDILKGVVQSGTGVGANIGRPQFGKTGTAQNASDAWFVGAIPQMVTAVWVGFPQGQVPMCCGNVRISTVYGGTWPASIWRTFMLAATEGWPVKEFGTAPNVDVVTLRVDVTQGCLANPYTPPGDIDVLQFPAGAEPTLEVCTEPSSYQLLVVPSVIGMERQAAISALHNAGFTVAMVLASSDQADRNGDLAGSRGRLSADPDRDGDDHRGQGRARTLADARPRHGAERDRHAARRRRGGDPAGGVRCVGVLLRGVRPGRSLVRLPARRGLVAVAGRRRAAGAGLHGHDLREPIALGRAGSTRATDGRPGETNALPRSKKRHRRSTPTLTPTRVLRATVRGPTGRPASRNSPGSFARSVPLSSRPIASASVRRAGPEHRSRRPSVPRLAAIDSNPSSGSAARSRTALPYPSGPVTTFEQKCMP